MPKSKRQRDLERIYAEYCKELKVQLSPDDIRPLSHQSRQCYDLSLVRRQLLWASTLLNNKGSGPWTLDDLYALARLRSRFPLCCWESAGRRLALTDREAASVNILGRVIKHRFDTTCVAWLCRGEIGKMERDKLNPLESWGWLSNPELHHMEKLKRSTLLVEKGFRTDATLVEQDKDKSALRVLVEQLRNSQHESRLTTSFLSSQSDIERIRGLTRLFSILRQLVDLNSDMPDAHRYFLTGEDLPDQVGDGPLNETRDYATTAFHECVQALSYHAVEQLLQFGFNVNARDVNGVTAFQLAHTLLIKEQGNLDRTQSMDLDGIVGLLGQHSVLWETSDLEEVDDLPLGWKCISKPNADIPVFQEKHFGSITFKKPSFSLFTDQRLALGYRRRNVAGQTYHLDLLRFLERRLPTKNRLRPNIDLQERARLTYTDEWYLEDLDATKNPRLAEERNPPNYSEYLSPLLSFGRFIWRVLSSMLSILSYFWLFFLFIAINLCIALLFEFLARLTQARAPISIVPHLLVISLLSYFFIYVMGSLAGQDGEGSVSESVKYSTITTFSVSRTNSYGIHEMLNLLP